MSAIAPARVPLPPAEAEPSPAEVANRLIEMTDQMMAQLELYAQDVHRLHEQRTTLGDYARRAQRLLAQSERQRRDLRAQLERVLERGTHRTRDTVPVVSTPPPAAHAPAQRSGAAALTRVAALVGMVAPVLTAAYAYLAPAEAPSTTSDPVVVERTVVVSGTPTVIVETVQRDVPGPAVTVVVRETAVAGATARASTPPIQLAARPISTPPSSGQEPPRSGARGGSPGAATTPSTGVSAERPGRASSTETEGPTGQGAATAVGAARDPAPPAPQPETPRRRAYLPAERLPQVARVVSLPLSGRVEPTAPVARKPEAARKPEIERELTLDDAGSRAPRTARGSAAEGPLRCALDLVVPTLSSGLAYSVRLTPRTGGDVTLLWPSSAGRIVVAQVTGDGGSVATNLATAGELPPAMAVSELGDPQLGVRAPGGAMVAAFLNDTTERVAPSHAVILYEGTTGCG